jgi:transposase InsO family protein
MYARYIVGWRVGSAMHTALVLDALERALYARRPPRGLVHQSDLGTPVVEAIGAEAKSRFTGRIPKITVEVK